MIIFQPRIRRIFALVVVILHLFIPHVHCQNENSDNHFYHRRRHDHHQLDEKVKEFDFPNKVHISAAHRNNKKYLAALHNFLSTTISFHLHPVQYILDESQKKVFSRGILSFLKSMIASQTEHDLLILSVSVTNIKSSLISDSAENTRQMNKDSTLHLQTVIAAQQNLEDTNLTQFEFSEYIMNLCSLYKQDMIQELKATEIKMMNVNNDQYEIDTKIFQNIRGIELSLSPDMKIMRKSGLSKTGIIILVCFLGLLVIVTAVWFSKHRRQRYVAIILLQISLN